MAEDKYKDVCEKVLTNNLEKVANFLINIINGKEKNEVFVKASPTVVKATGNPGSLVCMPISISDKLYAVELFNRLVVTKVVPNERKKPKEPDDPNKLDMTAVLIELSKKLGIDDGGKKDADKKVS